jgi:hypothetical protein
MEQSLVREDNTVDSAPCLILILEIFERKATNLLQRQPPEENNEKQFMLDGRGSVSDPDPHKWILKIRILGPSTFKQI